MPIARRAGWERALGEYFAASQSRPLVWGTFDCVLFTLGAAQAMTGVDPAGEIRGRYTSELGAAKLMRRLFGAPDLETAADAFAALWDGCEIPVLMAQRGDIVLADVSLGRAAPRPALAPVGLDGVHALFLGPRGGFDRWPLRSCRRAWHIGV